MHLASDILDNISTAVITLDQHLTVTAMNSSAQALLEASATRSVGQHADQLLLHPGDWLRNLQQALSGNSPLARRSLQLTLLTGQEIHVDLLLTPVPDSDGNTALLAELQPVDRLLRISREENMLSAQETTRTVVRGLAHEIKNPLGGLRGAAQLLARELPDESLAEYTNVIIREADRLRDLVDRMMGPNQQPVLASLNIHQVLEHVRNLVEAEAGSCLQLVRDYDPSIPELQGDRSQLIQAVLNIMRNALQANSGREHFNITLRSRTQRQYTIGATRHRLVCRVDIIDDGPGIPDSLQHAIFVPMVTGRPEGTGLGLSISQAIINRHGGMLECASEPGHTRFTLYLPLEDTNAHAS